MPNRGLYLISPPRIELHGFIGQLESAISGGKIAMFQLRLKDIPEAEILEAADKLLPICHDNSIKFIINDSAEIAQKCGADGVHIGSDDGDIAAARQLIGDKILGVSCYNSLELATHAAAQGADYVSFGAFYPTTTKIPRAKADIETILKSKIKNQKSKIAVIGGITPQNAAPLIAAGADYICAISYVWNHPVSPCEAVKELVIL